MSEKMFTIRSGDVGSEAFKDIYVEGLQIELAQATRERDEHAAQRYRNAVVSGEIAAERDALQAQLDAAISLRDEAIKAIGVEARKRGQVEAQLDAARAALTNIRQYASDTISGPVGVIETLGWHHVGWRWVLQRTQAALGTAAGAQEDGNNKEDGQ